MTRIRKIKVPELPNESFAFQMFNENLWNTEQLLDLGILGIDQKIEKDLAPLLKKFEKIKGLPGPVPKGYKPDVKSKKTRKNEMKIEFDQRSGFLIKKALEGAHEKHDNLRYFLYMSMAANIWAAFETYFQMLYGELFSKKPSMLKSNESITRATAIENKDSIVAYLIDQQVDQIGHMSLSDLLKFNTNKVKITFSSPIKAKLNEYYLIRNIVAHNSGIVRDSQLEILPNGVRVVDSRLRLSKTYLLKMIKDIRRAISYFEKNIEPKFFKAAK